MIKVKITSILKKGTRFFANILDRGSAFNNIPFIQPGGFVKRYKESETQFGWVVEKEGRRYVVAVEGQDFPDLKEDELVIYLNKDHYVKLSKDETAVYHDKSNYIKFNGTQVVVKTNGGDLFEVLNGLLTNLMAAKAITALGPSPLTPDTILNLQESQRKLGSMMKKG